MRFWSRRDWLTFGLTFCAALGVYIWSLPDAITMEDAGELAVAADTLGVPHPPGYPLWTMLAWLFQAILQAVTFRGYSNPAWAVAFMSAFFGALACALSAMLTCHFSRKLFTTSLTQNTSGFQSHLSARLSGAGWMLFMVVMLMLFPAGGRFLLLCTALLYLYVLPFQALTPQNKRRPFQEALPDSVWLLQALGSLLITGLCALTAWATLLRPHPFKVLLLTVAGLAAITCLMLLVDVVLGRAARQPGLSQTFRASGIDCIAGVGSGLLLAFSPLMWSQSVIVEVYSLNAFFLALLMTLLYVYVHHPRPGLLYWTAFLFGLGLTNHQSLLFVFFFLVAGVAAAGKRELLKDGLFMVGLLGGVGGLIIKAVQYYRLEDISATLYFIRRLPLALMFVGMLVACRGGLMKTWCQLLLLFLLGTCGMAFHLYMPIASEQNPPMNWGNTRTLDGFLESVTRGQYARFSVQDNLRTISNTFGTPITDADADSPDTLARLHARRTLFLRMLGAYFHDPSWKFSIANQFSLAIPNAPPALESPNPPPGERVIPLALLGLLPLLTFSRLDARTRNWLRCTVVAMFFLSVVFLIIQWPSLNLTDLWVKRVQYIQAHVLFAGWMALGGVFLLLLLYGLIPKRSVLLPCSILLFGTLATMPLYREFRDPQHLASLGTSSLHDYDFGWQYGFHSLKGANGILLDELAHHKDPEALWTGFAADYARLQSLPDDLIAKVAEASPAEAIPVSGYRAKILRPLKLSDDQERSFTEAVTLAAFRALPREEQAERLVYLHRPLPDWDYPAEFTPDAIFLGGTDPGRFVNTYMVISAGVRPDVFVLTQNALAQTSYLQVTRDYYGDEIYVPDDLDNQLAFRAYADSLRLYDAEAFLEFNRGQMQVTGFFEVMKLNNVLSRILVERNQARHDVYVEESSELPWMTPHQVPHGLIFKLSDEPRPLTPEEISRNMAFWEWMEEWLMETWKPASERSFRFHRELQTRKGYAKLRLAQARIFFERGLHRQAEKAIEQSLRFYPAGPETAQVAADQYMKLRLWEDAALVLAEYARHDPTNRFLPVYTERLQALRDRDERRKQLEASLDQRFLVNTVLELSFVYAELSMDREMEDMVNIILSLPSIQPEFYKQTAAFLRMFREEDLYLKTLERWVVADPDDPRPRVDLAVFALVQGDWETVYRHLYEVIRIDGEKAVQHLMGDARFMDVSQNERFQTFLEQALRKTRSQVPK